MKRIKLFIILFIFMFALNVKADMGPPAVVKHEVMVTNKDGAACYDNNGSKYSKTGKVIPYKTTLYIYDDLIDSSYVSVTDEKEDGYGCVVKFSDVSAKTQSFDLSKADKITPVKAVILAKGGLNMRKGPAVTYSKIMTIPEHAVVTVSYRAGDYWYYCDYNGHKGWITGMNGYFGMEGKEVLVSDEDMIIYSSTTGDKKVGKIPANTEITDYLKTVIRNDEFDRCYYVIYKGVKGYVEQMYYKTDGTGKIKLLKEVEIHDYDGNVIKKLSGNQELEYSMLIPGGGFRFSSKKVDVALESGEFEFVKKVDVKTKATGYIGEGKYGEAKGKVEDPKDEEPIIDDPKVDDVITPPVDDDTKKEEKNSSMSTKDIIIICLLAGILLALTAIVIIKLANSKKNKVVVNQVNDDMEERKE